MAQLHILLASFISILGCVVAIFTPWLNYSYDMSFGPIAATPPIKGPTILVGLFKCFSEVCETFKKVSSSPEKFKVPVQLKDSSSGTVTLYRVTGEFIHPLGLLRSPSLHLINLMNVDVIYLDDRDF